MVTMDNLLCIGGHANGERADIPSNQTYVNVAERKRIPIRPIRSMQPLTNEEMTFHYSTYKRRWFKFEYNERAREILIAEGTSDREAYYLIVEYLKKAQTL